MVWQFPLIRGDSVGDGIMVGLLSVTGENPVVGKHVHNTATSEISDFELGRLGVRGHEHWIIIGDGVLY